MRRLPAVRIAAPGRLAQQLIASSGGVLPRPVVAAAQQQVFPRVSEGEPFRVHAVVHAVQLRGVFQRQHVAALLVHPREIVAGGVDEGEMAGEHDVPRPHGPPVGLHPPSVHPQHQGLLIYRHLLRYRRQKAQGMELGLLLKAHRTLHREGQGGLGGKLRVQAQGPGGVGFRAQRVLVQRGVEIGRPLLQRAVDGKLPDDTPVLRNGALVDPGILPGLLRAEPARQLVVDQPVLTGDLGGGVPGLPASQPLRLQHHGLHPRLLQQPGGEHPRHAAADHGRIGLQVARQRRPGGYLGRFAPNRWHLPHLRNSFCNRKEIIPANASEIRRCPRIPAQRRAARYTGRRAACASGWACRPRKRSYRPALPGGGPGPARGRGRRSV